ncbi:hypothetical protein NKOR_08040 [Candidatus Nitrosopumilus koreensis AR1]|uniref:Uncharacterized protein n=1 Tax=Candidatus Nitrosopumilus koreensis AR1 TaxID=1229908 RepID=K0B7K3_9ARCH|nr:MULTISPECIES: SIR2 family protein [Nitrosopumilus]AFS81469.1 hypothetical protein NKOR_08040 [Candidatus Nitrosopumilus koreensis AR1]
MSGIDLKITKAERLNPKEISALFIPSLDFSKIIDRDTVYLMGPKGAGKSMVLNYLSFPVQIERFNQEKLNDYDKSYLGIYLRCNEHYFGSEKEILDEHGNPQNIWKKRFVHLFNLTVCEILTKQLALIKEKNFFVVTNNEEETVCDEIKEIFSLTSESKFHEIRKAIRAKIRDIRKTNITSTIVEECTDTSQLAEIQNFLQESIKEFEEKMLVVLLDEYHELSEYQQKVLSDIISVRKPLFKIASLPVGLTTSRVTGGMYLDFSQDYQVVNIGARNVTPGSPEQTELQKFFKLMVNKRLENTGTTIEELLDGEPKSSKNEDEKPDYSGLTNFVILSGGNAKTFLDLLYMTISKWDGSTRYIPRKVQQIAVKEFAREQMDGIDYIPAISVYLFRALILKIGLWFQNYLRNTKRNYLQIGIKDPENISKETLEILSIAIKRSYLMAPSFERYSRDKIKLLSITLNNDLLPYFDLPLTTHQVKEITAQDLENLVDKRSIISGTKIEFGEKKIQPIQSSETLIPHLGVVDEIVDHIKKDELAIFIGSGLSTELGYPTGGELARSIAKHFRIEYTGEDLSTIAERAITKRSRVDVIRFIKSVLEQSKQKESKSYSKLADLGVKIIFTTNWDTSIEDALSNKGHKIQKITRDESIPLATNDCTLVYKIHGDFNNPEMFVITDGDVLDEDNTRPGIINALKDTFLRKNFLFIGYSMSDLDFKTIFHLINRHQGEFKLTSYATVLEGPIEKMNVLKAKKILPLNIRGDVLISSIHEKLVGGSK